MPEYKEFPTIDYRDDLQLLASDVGYYKRILGITDWAIAVKVKPSRFVVCDSESVQGVCESSGVHRAAAIHIAAHDSDFIEEVGENPVTLCCMEGVLLHELLHLVVSTETEQNHQSLERCARAIIIARYGLPASFFDLSTVSV